MNPKSEIGAGAVAIYQQYPAPGQARFPSPWPASKLTYHLSVTDQR